MFLVINLYRLLSILSFPSLFEKNKNLITYFEQSDNKSSDELVNSQILADHARMCMKEIDDTINTIYEGESTHKRLLLISVGKKMNKSLIWVGRY